MKAPNKIYVAESRKIIGDIEHNVFSEQPFLQGSIEYIRKDLLLEWMAQYEKRTRTAIIPLLVKDFLEKLNSL